jgi:hypothetical protein
MPSANVDQAVLAFVTRLSDGPNIAADSIAGLVLRLLGRVGRLEQAVQQHGKKLEALAKQPVRTRTHDTPQTRVLESGIDFDGNRVTIEERIRRPRGRPSGARDHAPRARRRKPEGAELFHREDLEHLAEPVRDLEWDHS